MIENIKDNIKLLITVNIFLAVFMGKFFEAAKSTNASSPNEFYFLLSIFIAFLIFDYLFISFFGLKLWPNFLKAINYLFSVYLLGVGLVMIYSAISLYNDQTYSQFVIFFNSLLFKISFDCVLYSSPVILVILLIGGLTRFFKRQ